MSRPRRGEVWLVSLDPATGAEIKKTRPALIVQNDWSNRTSPVTIVAAISSKFEEPPYPTEVILEAGDAGLTQRSVALLNQLHTIDLQRLVKRLGAVGPGAVGEVDNALRISLALSGF